MAVDRRHEKNHKLRNINNAVYRESGKVSKQALIEEKEKNMWKDKAREVIAQVVRDVGTADETALKQALSKAYPFGERRMHPYKVWCEQVRKTLAGIRLQKTRKEQVTQADLLF
mgnify:CR=1 FL=1